MLRDFDLGLFVSLLEGEGHPVIRCIHRKTGNYKNNPRYVYQANITISNTNKPLLDNIKSKFGGQIYPIRLKKLKEHPNWSQSYNLDISKNEHIFDLLSQAFPYLIVKKNTVKDILIFLTLLKIRRKWKLTQEMKEIFNKLIDRNRKR